MTRFEVVVAMFPDLNPVELSGWIDRRWVQPEQVAGPSWVFHEIDLARVRLIYDLRRDLDTPEETMPLVLSLLDQVYELRCTLKTVMQTIENQPAALRDDVLKALGAERGGS